MKLNNSFEYQHFFYHFGTFADSSSPGIPLACLNGGIMVDSGSEAPDFIFACQDRYPPYAAFGRMRCLLFVRNEKHRKQYQKQIANIREHFMVIESFIGPLFDTDLPEPLYMPYSLSEHSFSDTDVASFKQQLKDSQLINDHIQGGVYLNQLSPTIAKLLGQFYGLLSACDINNNARLLDYEKHALNALKWHDKSSYLNLINNSNIIGLLPQHVPTVMLSSKELRNMTWERLMGIVHQINRNDDDTEFFIKSTMDSDGDVNTIVNKESFDNKINDLSTELAIKVNKMGRKGHKVPLLVQSRIKRDISNDMLPASVGLTYQIYDMDNFELVVVAGHVYDDAEHKTFIGSYLSDVLTHSVLNAIGEEKIFSLLRLFAQEGYRGPINLDTVRNSQGEYVFIYDCNPRLGGSFAGLIFRQALRRAGLSAETVLNIGYHGRFIYPDLKAKLIELDNLGLLYTQGHQKGVCLVPSLVRPKSFDPILINMEPEEMRELISSDMLSSLSDTKQRNLKGVHW